MKSPTVSGVPVASELTHSDYENYVTEVVRHFNEFADAAIYRNRRFPGVRQPGSYEVDLAVEFRIAESLRLLLIIECKHWSRPVDRPVVQKFAQTRDAISAHKAAIVSPVGFTEEAVAVAETLGIALWILSEAAFIPLVEKKVSCHAEQQAKKKLYLKYDDLRLDCLRSVGYRGQSVSGTYLISWQVLVPAPISTALGFRLSGRRVEGPRPYEFSFSLPTFSTFTHPSRIVPVLMRTTATAEIFQELLQVCVSNRVEPFLRWRNSCVERLVSLGACISVAEKIVNLVIDDKPHDFRELVESL